MADTIELEVVTPERQLVKEPVTEAQVPAREGYIGVLPGHAPLLSLLGSGPLTYTPKTGPRKVLAIHDGFVEVLPDRVTILAETAQKPEEIDSGAAQEQLQHGQKLWNEAGEDPEKYAHANEVMAEAEAKLESAGAGKH